MCLCRWPHTPVWPGITLTNPLRFRDLVLLNNQTNSEENGVYQVINLGNESEPWQLRRYGLADTTAELPVGFTNLYREMVTLQENI